MDKIIAVFFHEVVNRIIPGVVLIGFYYNQEIERAFHKFEHQDFFVVACLVVAAWLFGIMLDMVLWVPYRVLEILVYYDKDGRSILDRLPFFVRKIIKCFLREARHDTRLNDDHEHVRLDALKQQAEIVMSRSLVLISIFALFEPPNGLFAEEWHCYFSWFGILTFGPLSLLGYLYARRKEMHHKP